MIVEKKNQSYILIEIEPLRDVDGLCFLDWSSWPLYDLLLMLRCWSYCFETTSVIATPQLQRLSPNSSRQVLIPLDNFYEKNSYKNIMVFFSLDPIRFWVPTL